MTNLIEKKEISKRIEEHLSRHWLYLAHTEGSMYADDEGFKYISARPYNRVLYADWTDERETDIDRLLREHDREGDPLMWIVGPSTKPVDIDRLLAAKHFRYLEDWTGMAVALTGGSFNRTSCDDVEIKRVLDEKDLKKWVDVYVEGYQKPEKGKEAIFRRFRQILNMKQANYQLYLGLYRGEGAVAGVLFQDENTAGLYCITTAPAMRRKGLAVAYLEYVLSEAAQQGATSCILHATEAGKPAYEKLGFQSYCSFRVYLLEDGYSHK
jgi:GNAT superfamily N-acetyltransferase